MTADQLMDQEMNGELMKAIGYFTRETRIMDGLAVCAGRDGKRVRGWEGLESGERTVFDLASVTKIFTGIILMRLWEGGMLDPFRRVTWYCPEFRNLREVTVEQMMGFQVRINTPERVDRQADREGALRCLREAFSAGDPGRRAYSDIPAMILKYVIERILGTGLAEGVRRLVLEPAGMGETWARVPEDRIGDCLAYGPEYRIEGDNWIRRPGPERGTPHDPKAAILQGDTGDLCGHAGLFSTLGDMERLARAILEGKILREESLRRMTVNRTGRRLRDGTFTQYLGYCCYLKHPDQYFSEIPAWMSSSAFGIGGFTGNHFSVDPDRNAFTVFLGNRVRNRLTVLVPPEGKKREDYGLLPDGRGEIRWTDGTLHPSSANYVHQKDQHLHAVIEGLLAP